MKTKVLVTALFLAFSNFAIAESSTGHQAYEVALSSIRMPRTVTGTIAFRECEDCEIHTVRVSADTQWKLDGRAVPLQKFKQAMERVEDRKTKAVAIFRHVDSDRITAVSVYL